MRFSEAQHFRSVDTNTAHSRKTDSGLLDTVGRIHVGRTSIGWILLLWLVFFLAHTSSVDKSHVIENLPVCFVWQIRRRVLWPGSPCSRADKADRRSPGSGSDRSPRGHKGSQPDTATGAIQSLIAWSIWWNMSPKDSSWLQLTKAFTLRDVCNIKYGTTKESQKGWI